MFCVKCQKNLADCICPDLEERLKDAASSGYFVYKYCKKCGHHYAKCKCENPEWDIKNSENVGN